MAEKFENAKNAKGEPVDRKGNRIINLRETKTYYVTDAHPYVKDLGVGKEIKASAHTHGPDQLKKGWLSETKPEGKEPKKSKA